MTRSRIYECLCNLENKMITLGQVVLTCGVDAMGFEYSELLHLLSRHVNGDWGAVCEEDAQTNDDAVEHGDRVMSVYIHKGVRLWVITEWDRSVTTILLPQEY
jgi:hypothetical protein